MRHQIPLQNNDEKKQQLHLAVVVAIKAAPPTKCRDNRSTPTVRSVSFVSHRTTGHKQQASERMCLCIGYVAGESVCVQRKSVSPIHAECEQRQHGDKMCNWSTTSSITI